MRGETQETKAAPEAAKPASLDQLLDHTAKACGVDLEVARKDLARLKGVFPEGIPEGALNRWVDEFFHGAGRAFFLALGRAWEESA